MDNTVKGSNGKGVLGISPEGGSALGIAGLSEAAGEATSSSSCKSLHDALLLACLSRATNERRWREGVGPPLVEPVPIPGARSVKTGSPWFARSTSLKEKCLSFAGLVMPSGCCSEL